MEYYFLQISNPITAIDKGLDCLIPLEKLENGAILNDKSSWKNWETAILDNIREENSHIIGVEIIDIIRQTVRKWRKDR